jgi:hypothetical protein
MLDICLREPHAQPVQRHLECGVVGWIAHRRAPSAWLKLISSAFLNAVGWCSADMPVQ